jgi:hypothetical protein
MRTVISSVYHSVSPFHSSRIFTGKILGTCRYDWDWQKLAYCVTVTELIATVKIFIVETSGPVL